MRIIARFLFAVVAVVTASMSAYAQSVPVPQYLLKCVVSTGSCSGAWNSLADTTLGASYQVISIAGFATPADGGGGSFAYGGIGASCSTVPGVSAQDAGHNCYFRLNYNGSPLEWNATFSGVADEYTALNDWFNSSGLKLMGTAGTAVVEEPLSCSTGGRAVFFQGNPVGTADGTPPILIQANDSPGLLSNHALISVTSPLCRFSGIALQGNVTGNYYTPQSGLYDGIDIASSGADHLHLDDGTWIASFNNNIGVSTGGGGEGVDFSANDVYSTYAANFNLQISAGATDWTVLGSKFAFAECNQAVYPVGLNCPAAGGQNVSLSQTSDGIFVANLLENSGNNCGDTQTYCTGNVGLSLYQDEGLILTGNSFNIDNCNSIELDGSQAVSVFANKFHGAGYAGDVTCGADGAPATTAFIELGSKNLNVVVGGNAFYYDTQKGATSFGPDYVYQCVSSNACGAEWSNIDPWVPPAASAGPGGPGGCNDVWSAAGSPYLCGRFADQQTADVVNSNQHPDWKNYITGFGLTWNNGSKVTIAIGQATDGGNAVVIMPWHTCQIDMTTVGPGGLDTGSVGDNTTYYLYAGMLQPGEAQQDGQGNLFYTCMASTSYPKPTLSFSTTGTTMSHSSSLSVGSTNGLFQGAGVSAATGAVATSAAASQGSTTVNLSSIPSNLVVGAPVSDATAPGAIAAGTSVTNITGTVITLSTKTVLNIAGPPLADSISYSDIPYGTTVSSVGSGSVALSQNALYGTSNEVVTFTNPYLFWRAASVIITDPTDSNIPQFIEVGNRIAYFTPVTTSQMIGIGSSRVVLAGAPVGPETKVQGKCVAGGTAFNLAGNGQAAPRTSTLLSPTAIFPYDLYTDTSAEISARAAMGSPTLTCEVDSYEWSRGS